MCAPGARSVAGATACHCPLADGLSCEHCRAGMTPPRCPGVRTALAARNHVVDVFGRCAAVLAAVTVPSEHGPPVERHPSLVRYLDVIAEPHDRRLGDGQAFGPEHLLGGVQQLGLVSQDEHESPAT